MKKQTSLIAFSHQFSGQPPLNSEAEQHSHPQWLLPFVPCSPCIKFPLIVKHYGHDLSSQWWWLNSLRNGWTLVNPVLFPYSSDGSTFHLLWWLLREIFLDQLHKSKILPRKLEVDTFTGLPGSGVLWWIFCPTWTVRPIFHFTLLIKYYCLCLLILCIWKCSITIHSQHPFMNRAFF